MLLGQVFKPDNQATNQWTNQLTNQSTKTHTRTHTHTLTRHPSPPLGIRLVKKSNQKNKQNTQFGHRAFQHNLAKGRGHVRPNASKHHGRAGPQGGRKARRGKGDGFRYYGGERDHGCFGPGNVIAGSQGSPREDGEIWDLFSSFFFLLFSFFVFYSFLLLFVIVFSDFCFYFNFLISFFPSFIFFFMSCGPAFFNLLFYPFWKHSRSLTPCSTCTENRIRAFLCEIFFLSFFCKCFSLFSPPFRYLLWYLFFLHEIFPSFDTAVADENEALCEPLSGIPSRLRRMGWVAKSSFYLVRYCVIFLFH